KDRDKHWEDLFFSSRRRHTRSKRDWSSDVCSSDLPSPGTGRTAARSPSRWCARRPRRPGRRARPGPEATTADRSPGPRYAVAGTGRPTAPTAVVAGRREELAARGSPGGAEAARVLERGRRGCDGVWRHEMAYTPGPVAIDPPTTRGHRAARAERCRRRGAGSTEAVPRPERVPCDPADPAVAPLFTGSPAVLLLSRTHEAREDSVPDQAAVRPVRCAPHTEEKEGPPYGFAS